MKIKTPTLEPFRDRLANLEALPQFAILGIISGVVTGLVILLLRLAIEIPLRFWLPNNNPENFEALDPLTRFLAPCIGAVLVGILLSLLKPQHRGVGVVYVLERLNLHQGYLSVKNALTQFFVAVVSLVSGGSAGREGPAIHLGATCNSWLGRRFGLPNNSIRVLIGCGTAGAIAASFNTPIAGVIFAMEVIMMEYTIVGFTPVILSAVSATLISRLVYGPETAFSVPQLALNTLWDIPFIVVMGIILGCLSSLFIKIIKLCAHFRSRPMLLRAAVAGIISGLLAIAVPATMGVGYDSVNQALLGEIGIVLLIALALGKLAATAVCVGVGLPYGLIGPVVVVGAAAGAALGVVGNILFPNYASDIGIYTMLGMGAMMGAVLQAPLAALMALLELTGNPNIILPGMLTIVTANLTARVLFKQQSVYQVMLGLAGIHLNDTPVLQALRRVGVVSLMNKNVVSQQRQISWDSAAELLKNNLEWIVITEERKPLALLPAADLARYIEDSAQSGEHQTETNSDSTATVAQEAGAEHDLKAFDNGAPDNNTIDLLEIPARRGDVRPIHRQATLQEALDTLHKSNVEALYVERVQAPMISSVMGIITREAIENHYLHRG